MSCTPKGDDELALLAGYCLSNLRLHIRKDGSHSVVILGRDRDFLYFISEGISRRIGATKSPDPRWFSQYGKGSIRWTRDSADKVLELLSPYMGHIDRLKLIESSVKQTVDPFENFTPPRLPWE